MEAVLLLAAVGLLAGNFFFVAVEFAVTRTRPTMAEELVREGVRGSRSLAHAVEHLDAYLSACQLGITICSIGLGITAEPVVSRALEAVLPEGRLLGLGSVGIAFAIAYATVSMFHVVLGELAPKSLAIARTRPTGLVLAPPMRVFYLATKPAVDLFNWLGNLVLRPFGIPPAREAGSAPHSEKELRRLIAESQHEGLLHPEEHAFAEGAFLFGDRRARDVMVPRADARWVTADVDAVEVARAVAATGHTRLPVAEPEGELESAFGVVHVKELVRALAEDRGATARDLARPLRRVPAAMLLDDLLDDLRDSREQIALVVDEHGTAVGLITLEDVLEEIVGEIEDEFDGDEEPAIVRDGERLHVRGSAPLDEVAGALSLEVEERLAATVGGHVTEKLGRLPAEGEHLRVGRFDVEVRSTGDGLVRELVFAPARDSQDGE